jgi:hypothetical protein
MKNHKGMRVFQKGEDILDDLLGELESIVLKTQNAQKRLQFSATISLVFTFNLESTITISFYIPQHSGNRRDLQLSFSS